MLYLSTASFPDQEELEVSIQLIVISASKTTVLTPLIEQNDVIRSRPTNNMKRLSILAMGADD